MIWHLVCDVLLLLLLFFVNIFEARKLLLIIFKRVYNLRGIKNLTKTIKKKKVEKTNKTKDQCAATTNAKSDKNVA